MILREAGECAGLPVPVPLPDGEEFVRRLALAKEILADDEGVERSILFVDELHILLETGAMSEILKPLNPKPAYKASMLCRRTQTPLRFRLWKVLLKT